MSKVIRSVKNVTKGYSSVQIKVREATSNDPWGPTGTQMTEIAALTYNSSTEFYEIMDMLDKRLNDKGKNWRHVLKALKVMDYALHEGSELVVTWAKQNIFIIKTLREFIYIDEEGKDVGHNVRVAAKELTSLILDEDRLRIERADRKIWKNRVLGLEDYNDIGPSEPRRQRPRPQTDEEDLEYRLALEASKNQEEEDRRKREGRRTSDAEADDLAKAIRLSKEEEERRRRELEESNANSLFDATTPTFTQSQPTGLNQGYQQGNAVDFFANPIDQNQMQMQPTGYMQQNPYGNFQNQPTGFQNGFQNGFGAQPTGYDAFGQQNATQQPYLQQTQPTGFGMYGQQPTPSPISEPSPLPGSNNPWSPNNNFNNQSLKPIPTGSNNPFAQQQQPQRRPSFSKPSPFKTSSLGILPESNALSNFSQPPPAPKPQPASQQPQNEHQARLNALLANGEGMDTFGNTGQLRIPAQHTAPGTFVNSAGSGAQRLAAEKTGSNPFLTQQFTGMPAVSYPQQQHMMPAVTGPAGMMNGFGHGHGANNPFAGVGQGGQQQNSQDLIQF